ncbi:hypothetical protein K504DRAFT_466071 [Pleomassaria siparia CBS 279.74]|uniref:F-box domain-containing protein n=1 Tax=Pleomassaria siparia CBS 279.74 TaxID=1314801 RepID=A0A6G1KEH9_9PLEO|nr:hypothetical protein K504DRAFT_466071 [Pleomassaria siparia CBS 279.74]
MPKLARKITRNASNRVDPITTSTRTRTRARLTKSRIVNQQTTSLSAKSEDKASTTRLPRKKKFDFSFLARSQERVEQDPNRQTGLFSLPKELVQHIAQYLSLASTICLTLTCKEAADVIGIDSWAEYRKEKQWSNDRKEFGESIVRDWGEHFIFCLTCNALHPPLLLPPRTHRETRLTKCCFGQEFMIDYLPQDASHGYMPVLQHIFDAMKQSEAFATKGQTGPDIDELSGDFTLSEGNLNRRLQSSARRIDRNLVITHIHTFQSTSKKALCAMDLLALPIRLCPHESTAARRPDGVVYMRDSGKNRPLLTHAINTCFPTSTPQSIDLEHFKKPTSSEQEQMSMAQAGELVHWRCSKCPTKFHVEMVGKSLVITSWHSFGRDLYHAAKYWKFFVRRHAKNLGPDKRNDEWWSPNRTVPDFACE